MKPQPWNVVLGAVPEPLSGWLHRVSARFLLLNVPFVLGIAAMFSGGKPLSAQSPTLHISPVQEQNFKTFMAWAERDEVFAQKTEFRNAIQNAFNAAKANDLSNYPHWVAEVKKTFDALSSEEQLRLYGFMMTELKRSTPARGNEDCKNCCTAEALFTSCTIQCTGPELSRCRGIAFFASCECLR